MLPVSNTAVVILLASHSLFGQKLDMTIDETSASVCSADRWKKEAKNKENVLGWWK